MIQNIIVGIIIVMALALAVRKLWRTVNGKGDCCSGNDCPHRGRCGDNCQND